MSLLSQALLLVTDLPAVLSNQLLHARLLLAELERSLVVTAFVLVLGITGLSLLLTAGFLALLPVLGPPVTALLTGVTALLLAAGFLFFGRTPRRL